MRKLIYFFLMAGDLAYKYAAGAPVLARPAAPPPPPSAVLLWQVAGARPGWIYGTLPRSGPAVARVPPAVRAALRAARSFHPEVALAADLGPRIAVKILLAREPDLAGRVPRRTWERTVDAAAAVGLPEPAVHRLSPGLAALLLSGPPEPDLAATLDGRLYAAATQLRLRVEPLETLDEQLAAFLALPEPAASALLQDALAARDAGYPDQARVERAYLAGDERRLAELTLGEFRRSPATAALAGPLLERRNRLMAARASAHLRAGGAFIAVGAGHVVGPSGLVELLRRAGWHLTRVPG